MFVAPLLQVPSHSPSTGVSDDDTLNPWKYRSEIFWKFVPFKLYSLALFCNSFTESQKCTNAFITCELLWICCNFRQLGNKLRLVHAGLNKVGEVVLPLVLPLMQSCSITRRTEGHDPSNGLVDVLTNSRLKSHTALQFLQCFDSLLLLASKASHKKENVQTKTVKRIVGKHRKTLSSMHSQFQYWVPRGRQCWEAMHMSHSPQSMQ